MYQKLLPAPTTDKLPRGLEVTSVILGNRSPLAETTWLRQC